MSKAYIGYKYITRKQVTNIICPHNGSIVDTFPNLVEKDVELAFNTAKDVQKVWREVAPKTKVSVFLKFAELIKENKNEFVKRMVGEISKSKKDSESEVNRTVEFVLESVEEYKKLLDNESFGDLNAPSKIGIFKRVPLGVILAISPFNYPLNLAVSKLVPSLLVGNTVVFKSATQGTSTGALIVELLYKAGLEKGALQFVTGRGRDIGDFLTSNRNISLINFTGSHLIGEKTASANPMVKKIFELSGKDPAIVLKDADLESTANAIIKGSFSYSGQRCTAIKRVLVHTSVEKELIKILKKKVGELKVSNKPEKNPDIVPVIDEWTAKETKELVQDALDKGADLVLGNKFVKNLVYPTLLSNVNKSMKLYYQEQFAPVLPIISFKTIEEAIEISNDSEFGLGGAIFTKCYPCFWKIASKLETGRVTWNSTPARGPDNFPFTGVKKSGTGIQGIKHVMIESTYPKGYVLS